VPRSHLGAPGRYASLQLIPWWQQSRIARTRVMVVGAGALGNEILKNLALLGIGHIFIIDFDDIEASNLTRSVLYREEDIGSHKVEVAAKRVKEINPDVKVAFLHGDVTTDIGLGLIRSMDVMIGAVDNFAARIFINRASFKTGTPWINGGIIELVGEAHVYLPGKGACFECNLPPDAYRELRRRFSCQVPREEIEAGRVPTTPTIASIIGAIQVQEALKLIHRVKVTGGSGLVFNGNINQSMEVQFALNQNCYIHDRLKGTRKLNRSVANTTFRELLDISHQDIGRNAAIELDFNIVTDLNCSCGYRNRKVKRLDKLRDDELRCPRCQKMLRNDIKSIIDRSTASVLDCTLEEAGMPPWHIITAKNKAKKISYEFDADKGTVLNYI